MDKLRAASFSILVNLVLASAKLAVGLLTNSLGILAEFLHSLFDLLASVFAFLGIRKAQEPADRTHPYGHEKFENLSSLLQTILIFVTAIWVAYEAIMRLYHPQPIESTQLGLAVMLAALAIDWFFSKFLHDVSKKEGSVALEADAYHFTSDLWSTGAVIAGLVFASIGMPWADSVAALLVSLLMIKLSFSLGMKALNVLLDKGASAEELERIVTLISKTKEIKGYHKLRTRHMGSRLVVDLHIQVEGKMTIEQAHKIAHLLKGRITQEVPVVKDVLVHVEPLET
ncbi:cation transporter, partial [Candidatus Micrarchaeota archaeon]|nr:cation transporter [Candidatus Micrarchaeota archaeon]